MRAVTFSKYDSPDVLVSSEVDTPQPGPGQVRVAVRAAGVNPMDVKIRRGDLQKIDTRQPDRARAGERGVG